MTSRTKEDELTSDGDVTRSDRVIVALAMAVTAGLGLASLSASSVWLDEAYTIAVATAPAHDFLSDLLVNGGNMSLYLVLMRFWLMLGDSEFWLRLPSVVFATATIPIVFCLARRLAGRRAALMAVVLLAMAPPLVRYSHEGRSYTLLVLTVAASWLALVRFVDESSGKWWYVLLAALSIYTHVIGVVFVAAQLVWLAVVSSPRRAARVGFLVLLLAEFQLLITLWPGAASPDWIPALSRDGVGEAVRFLVGASSNWQVLVVASVWLIGGWVAVRSGIRGVQRGAMAAFLWVLLPIVAILSVSLLKPLLVPRYLLPAAPAGALLAAMAFSRLRRLGWIAVAALVVVSWPALDSTLHRRNPDWRAASALIFENTQPDDAIVFLSGSRPIAEYYWVRDGRPPAPTPIFEPYEWRPPRRAYPAIDLAQAAVEAKRADRFWVLRGSGDIRPTTADLSALDQLVGPRELVGEWQMGPSVRVMLYE